MERFPYNIIDEAGNITNWMLQRLGVIDATGAPVELFEGDFAFDAMGILRPLLRLDTVPFGGWLSGSNMVFQVGISDGHLLVNPRLACIGSSTMAGTGLSAPDRLQDHLSAWLAANAVGATLVNLALGGQNMANLRPTASGGTAGRNIDAAIAENPTFILCYEPTNWAALWDAETQISYMDEIFLYAAAHGIVTIFPGSLPRTPYDSTQKSRLVQLNQLLSVHPRLKYFSCINFDQFLQPATTADLRNEYDQGDGIHINAAGAPVLSNSITDTFQLTFKPVTAFDQIEIEKSADGATGWAVRHTVMDMTTYRITMAAETGYYRARGRLKDGSYTDYSEITHIESAPVMPQRLLFDIGGDGVQHNAAVTNDGIMTPNNSIGSGAVGVAPDGKKWNNVVDVRAAWFNNPVDTEGNEITGLSMSVDKLPAGTFFTGTPEETEYPHGDSLNFGGNVSNVGDYPSTAVRDNVFFHTSAGIVTATISVPSGKIAAFKFWGNRAAAGPRILQIRKAGEPAWQEYDAGNNINFSTAVTITGLVGVSQVEMQVKSGSTFGHISVIDISVEDS